jgi:alkylation response protein AidB-like acyl-CoA dehydrogenase
MHTRRFDVSRELERITNAFSESDREQLGSALVEVVGSSEVARILDESRPSGSGTLRDVLYVCSALGKTDASLAWIIGVSNSAWSVRSNFRALEPTADTERNWLHAMVLGRPGRLRRDEASSGWRLSGEWHYASGSRCSSLFFGLASVEGSEGRDVRMVAVPARALEVVKDWRATGLRGTQSVAIAATDVQIPDGNVEDYARILSGRSGRLGASGGSAARPSYAGLFTGVLMNCLLGAVLGATEAAFELVAAAAVKKPIAGSSYASMRDSGAIRAELGRLRCSLDLYKRAAEHNADVIDEAAHDAEMILSVQDRVDIRGRATQVMRGCVNIVQDLLWIYGSSGLERGHPLERIWRDVNVGARHGGFSKLIAEEAVGLATIGSDPRDLTKMF